MSELARGTYRYWRDGALQPIVEPWTLRRGLDGSVLLRGRRQMEGAPLLDIEADYAGAHCTGMRLRWHPAPPDEPRTAHYRLDGAALHWRFADAARYPPQTLPANTLLFPLLRAATGPLLSQLDGAPRTVVLPSLRDPAGSDGFLRPLLSERRALENGVDAEGLRRIRFLGGEYGETGADCALGPEGLMRHYRWESPNGVWDVRLEDAWWEPEFRDFAPP